MKTRNGFVSNSSSSSFCLIGIGTDINDSPIADVLKYDETNEKFDELCREHGLTYAFDYECEYVYIGLNMVTMKDDQTKKEFYELIKTRLKNMGFEDPHVELHYGTIYN